MNATALRTPSTPRPTQATRPYTSNAPSSTGSRRERDFGVGYGSSSGYATSRQYVSGNGPRLFRCA